MFRKTGSGFALVAVLIAGCLWVFTKLDVKLGIDLRGGTELTYSVDITQVAAARRATALEEMRQILQNRLDSFGMKELSVTPQPPRNLVIQIPSTDNNEVEAIKRIIEQSGRLTIHLVSAPDWQAKVDEVETQQREHALRWQANEDRKAAGQPAEEMPEWPDRLVIKDANGAKVVVESAEGTYVEGSHLESSYPTLDQYNQPAVGFEFDSVGAAAFANLTGPNIGQRLAMNLDGIAKSVATIQNRISNRGQLTGN
ncbi:MAG: hypothetical protein KDC38_19100, partial [Planctomycetes bacterium]|nr:hypothetical protein [Planctomycetota bacterium]